MTLTNCIVWGNGTIPSKNEIYVWEGGTITVNYCNIERGWSGGVGNIDADPLFRNPLASDFHLTDGSPCIDAGNTTAVQSGILVDSDGNPRGLDDPASPDTGISFLGVTVDMGAYEFQPCPIAGDNNCDGDVDFKDLAILCNNWLTCTGPEL
jgi:hypothetical protein